MARYTFNPPEDELIHKYLNNKIVGNNASVEGDINEVHICQHEPPDLPGLAKIQSTHTWYFFSPVEKLGTSNRTKRATGTGNWKITGKSCRVKDIYGQPIGLKKFLVFQENNASSSTALHHKTTWIIHEFHSFLQHPNREAYVLCKLMKKAAGGRRRGPEAFSPGTEPSLSVSSDSVLTQSQTAGEIQEPTPSSALHDDNTSDSSLPQSRFFHLQSQSLTDTISPWDGSISSNHLAYPLTISEINNDQIQEAAEFSNGSSYNNMSPLGHVYGQNAVDIAKSWEQSESGSMMASDTVLEARNYQIQETGELADRSNCYKSNMSQLGLLYEQGTVDSPKPREQGESSFLAASETISKSNNFQIQETAELVGGSCYRNNMPQFGILYGQDTVDIPNPWKPGGSSSSMMASDAVSSQIQDIWGQNIQESQRPDGSDTCADDIPLWPYLI